MPRQTQKRIKGQKQVVAQSTFDFTVPQRDVAARPVDPYSQPGSDPKVANVLSFLQEMKGTLHTATQLSDMISRQQREKGKAARGRQEEAPEDAHWAFLEGYEMISGMADAYDYEKQMTELLEKSWRDDVNEFELKKDALGKQYLNGATDAYVDGFLSRGMAVENRIEKEFEKRQREILQENFLTKSMKIFKLDSQDIVNDDSIKDKAQARRDITTKIQETAVEYGLSKSQVSEAILKTAGAEADLLGKPEELAFLYTPDSTGVAIADNPKFAEAATRYVEGALSTRKALETEARLARERLEKDYAVAAGKTILEALDGNDPGKAQMLLEKTGRFMNFTMFSGLQKALTNMREGSDTHFGSFTDQTTFDYLRILARAGNLSLSDLEERRESLTKTDYRAVFADLIYSLDKERSREQSTRKSITETTMERVRATGRKVVAQEDTIGRILNPETAPLRALRYELYFGDYYNKIVDERGGRAKMTSEDMQYVADKAIWMSFQDYEPRNLEKMPVNPDATKTSQDTQQTDQPDDSLDFWLDEKE
ncbi:MAG: hypothetical protein E3J94_04940 [Desulfobacteraceae bacterium]|nr:MAG: hypothetical protein E3J94_04940 [Desulfobacteraceae bacterium]